MCRGTGCTLLHGKKQSWSAGTPDICHNHLWSWHLLWSRRPQLPFDKKWGKHRIMPTSCCHLTISICEFISIYLSISEIYQYFDKSVSNWYSQYINTKLQIVLCRMKERESISWLEKYDSEHRSQKREVDFWSLLYMYIIHISILGVWSSLMYPSWKQ